MQKLLIALLVFAMPSNLLAQFFPKEGSLLNYRIIGFSFQKLPAAKEYKIEIAKGNYTNIDSFSKNIIQTVESKDSRKIAEVPAFGSQYTWRVVYKQKKETESTALFHFSTLMNDRVDTNKLHLRILQSADEQYKDDYVVVDAGGVLYDMTGKPVWFIPDTNGIVGNASGVIKFTPQATVTFFSGGKGYEINYNGDVLWKTPNESIVGGGNYGEGFHHEFTRLSSGHYMVLGTQILLCKLVANKDTSYISVTNDKTETNGYKRHVFGTIIEYDEKGNIVWSWKSSEYLMNSDFSFYMKTDSTGRYDAHDNAFYFDEKNKCVYLGYRNLNRIIKIEYPSGRVLRTYGEIYKPGVPQIGEGLFSNQHSIGRSLDGYLYLFNNNSGRLIDSLPTVVFFQEPVSTSDTFKKIWKYTCTIDTSHYPKNLRKRFGAGGNAKELADRSVFVNMGSEYSKLFIVNREKRLLWSALPERFMMPDAIWTPIKEYRADIISRKDLEQLIWRSYGSPGVL